MGIFKRILAWIVIVVSALGLILCLVGIIEIWVLNTSLTDGLTSILGQVDDVLVSSGERVTNIKTNLINVQDTLIQLDETIIEVGDQLTENSPTLTLISNTVGTKLQPKIETTAQVFSALRETVISVNSTLETVNKMPFVSVPTLPMDELSAIDQQMQEMVVSVQALGDAIKEKEAGVIERTTEVFTTPIGKLNMLVEKVLTPVGKLDTAFQRVETAIVATNDRIPALIDWWSVLITFALFWFVLAQASLLYSGWYYWKTGTIPAVKSQSNQISQEAQNETDSSDIN